MDLLRQKKHAMISLKKDVTDLLANGFDVHAFGRVCFFTQVLYCSIFSHAY
jgi:hypothetical protein